LVISDWDLLSLIFKSFLLIPLYDFSDISQGSFMMNSEISEQEKQDIIKHIDELKYAEKRDNALLELSR
jgi:hypothetical protein